MLRSILPLVAGLIAGAIFGYLLPNLFMVEALSAKNLGYTAEVGAGLRWTAFSAFAVFLIPLYARSMHTLLGNAATGFIMRQRRNAGVLYGGIQIIHICLIVQAAIQVRGAPADMMTMFFGGTTLFLVVLMTLTSFPSLTHWLSGNSWRKIHKSGMAFLVSIYLYDFVAIFFLGAGKLRHGICGALVVGGVLARAVAFLTKKARKRKIE